MKTLKNNFTVYVNRKINSNERIKEKSEEKKTAVV